MSAEVVDFVARLSAIKRGLQVAQDARAAAEVSALYHDIESSHIDHGPSGGVDLMDLQSALLELRAELVKKQAELGSDGMDMLNAIRIGAQAEVIMLGLTRLASEIARLERTN
ncbi:hypothetical protein [Devosia beringensis]|uniref:hypothetical protein n=1 Tax=Devosia beringensis TaxID=2657486 RepID=UPI00186B5D94|nr:hypothetical protein [Devosia beringensis]